MADNKKAKKNIESYSELSEILNSLITESVDHLAEIIKDAPDDGTFFRAVQSLIAIDRSITGKLKEEENRERAESGPTKIHDDLEDYDADPTPNIKALKFS